MPIKNRKAPKTKKTDHRREFRGILLMLLALLILLSLFTYDPTEEPVISPDVALNNFMGIFGVYVSHYLYKMTIGWGSFAVPVIMAVVGFLLTTRKSVTRHIRVLLYILGLGFWTGTSLEIPRIFGHAPLVESSLIGYTLANFIHDWTGAIGLILILTILFILIILGLFSWSPYDVALIIFYWCRDTWLRFTHWVRVSRERRKMRREAILEARRKKALEKKTEVPEVKKPDPPPAESSVVSDTAPEPEASVPEPSFLAGDEKEEKDTVHIHVEKEAEGYLSSEDEPHPEDICIEEMEEVKEGDLDSLAERRARYRQYKLPLVELLYSPPDIGNTVSEEILMTKADQLHHALKTFNVLGKVVRISPGPVITLFEVEPAEGVRVSKFTNLSDDLARIMKAQRIRIIAPIPGSKTVGIELPNDNPSTVYLRNIINSEKYISSSSKLTIAMGKTTTGDAYVVDIAKMPHLLIAGATGSGKSVCINTIIISILYKAKPDEVKFIMIDPKKLELSSYKALVGYHLITSPDIDEYVMTSPDNAVAILNAALIEMERRYTLFAEATVRNIIEYNEKRKINPDMENVPYIVVIIDELADLMMTAGKNVEEPITRLAQMARAVGIHLIVATQRPSVDVITGLIKANFPARIAFQVSQKVDSRTIIDQMGAEKLLGRGDMLFLPPGASMPLRLHNAFITLDEIEEVMAHIAAQPKPEEIMLPETEVKSEKPDFLADEEQDELLWDAARLVIEHQQASVSLLQRRFRIGYSRAGRLIDELEALGVVSGYSGSKARDVLVDETYLENLMK